jgi:adenine-specific DNA methylase
VTDLENKRLIEVDFPLKEVSEESIKEKNIRHGHISTLHIWWARRPLAASRATIYAALTSAPKNYDDVRKKFEFIAELSKWENSLNQRLIENASREIREHFGGTTPRVLDCFAGGGAIPLEALRLGCETYALEYNPVAILILKATLEYPQKFGKGKTTVKTELCSVSNPLIEDVKKWGQWVLEEAWKEIGKFYPSYNGNNLVCYLWARTVKCQNPSCGVEIPLMRQFWLSKKKSQEIALKMFVNKERKTIDFRVVRGKDMASYDPSQGTTRRATVLCPICGAGIDDKTLRREAKEGRMNQRLIAVVIDSPDRRGKEFKVVKDEDVRTFKEAEQYLNEKIKNWQWDFDPLPDEPLPPVGTLGFRINRYGMNKWKDLFNNRQKLALITFVEKVRLAHEKMTKEGYDPDYAKAVLAYLAIAVDRLASFNSTLALWVSEGGFIANTFTRQALPMIWDYAELNPFSGATGGWHSAMDWILRVIQHCSKLLNKPAFVVQGTSTRLPYPDNFFDAIMTDPPYYDNVPYSDLSNFFYVWLKRTIGDLYPELFSTPLTPKTQEIIMHPAMHGNDMTKAKRFFEDMITQSFQEIYRVLKPEGIATIVFAYKSTEAWETIINGLIKSGLVLTASWPIHTERTERLRAKESAALASSIYMVCRKRTKEKIAYFNEIKKEIESRIREKLTQFWEQGISGADLFVSAIGPAVEVFGRYSKVEKLSGEEVSVQELLEYVRKIVSEFALERVLKRADLGGVDAETRFYLLWRWTFGNAKVHFDDAIKLSRPMGVELTQLWDGGSLVKKEKESVKVLAPQERAKDPAFLKKTKFTSMIDVLHYVLALWERGEREKIKEILNETGYAGNEIFWQTAQAISEILPQGDKEKQLLQGFLYGKDVYVKEARGKTSLLDYMESK